MINFMIFFNFATAILNFYFALVGMNPWMNAINLITGLFAFSVGFYISYINKGFARSFMNNLNDFVGI